MAENPKTQAGQKKPPLHLVPASAIIHASAAMADGAEKYGPYNWREPTTEIPASIYVAAAKRHLDAFFDGEWTVPDSSHWASHLGAVIAGVGVLIDAFEVGTVLDDRPPAGTSSRSQESWQRTGTLWLPPKARDLTYE